MRQAWTGDTEKEATPKIRSLSLNRKTAPASIEARIGDPLSAEVKVDGADDALISWRLREEVPTALQSDGGDFEPTPPTIESLLATQNKHFDFKVSQPGEYRLYCQVDTPHQSSAVTNIPFLITSKPRKLARFLNLFGNKAA